MSPRPVNWYPPCYNEVTLLHVIQEVLGISPAIAGVARWLPGGCTSRQVALALGKSVHTVKVQARQLEIALGATNRTELASQIVAAVWHHAWARGELAAGRPTPSSVAPGALPTSSDARGGIDRLMVKP